MNEMSDMCSNMCSSIGKGAECFHSSPLREKSYSPKRRISLANPQHIELAKLNFDYSNQVVSAKLSPRSQFQVVGNYDILKTIGKGQFGKVKLAKHVLTNDLVAVKVINKQKLDQVGKKIFEMEMTVMKKLSHPNIIRLYEVIETDKFYFLFMEYASGGEVLDYIVMHQSLSEKKARNLFRQIISAISHCHNNSIVHRDLKGENLLLDSNLTIKVIDFGLSNLWSPTSFLKTACGSPLYASPEIIEHKEYIGPEVDIWSMGVLLFVFLIGLPPFEGDDLLSLYNKILNCDYKIPEDKKLTNECRDILSRILVLDPSNRATMKEIINHPWVKGEDNWNPLEFSSTPITVDSIDRNLLVQLEYLGYSKESVIDSLLHSKFNSPSAIYYLLQSKRNQQNDSLISLQNTSSKVLKLGSNPISSLQRKRAELNNVELVSGRRRANSECPEYTIVPVPIQPPIHRKRSQSRNETQIRNATSHLVNHYNPTQFSLMSHNFQTAPSESIIENLQNAGRRESEYVANRAKRIYRNEVIHDDRDEIKRNTDDNIVFIRNLKDRTIQKLMNNNNNNAKNVEEVPSNINSNVNKIDNNNAPPVRRRGSSIPSKVIRNDEIHFAGEKERDDITNQTSHHDLIHSTPRIIQSNAPMNIIPIDHSMVNPITMKNIEARRCRSVSVNNDKEKETPPIIMHFLNVEGKKGRSTSPVHIPHLAIPIANNNNDVLAQPKQLTELEFEELKHRLEEEKKQVSGTVAPQVSSNWQSFLSWTKQLLQTRAENDKPRSIRTVFNNYMTSNKPPQEILAEIKRVLMKFQLPFEHNSPYSLKAVDSVKKVHFEVEVCQLPKISQMYVRINRIAGKWEDYKELCENVVSELDL